MVVINTAGSSIIIVGTCILCWGCGAESEECKGKETFFCDLCHLLVLL